MKCVFMHACVCVCVCTWTDEYVLSVSVYCVNVDHYSCWPLYAFWLELDTRDKRLHICACVSRITCSIECVPLLSAYHSLRSLISFLSLLNGFLSLSPHHKRSLSPLLFFNTYKTEKTPVCSGPPGSTSEAFSQAWLPATSQL